MADVPTQLEQLQELKDVLTLQKDVITAQKDLIASKFPVLPAGKEGRVEFKNEGVEGFSARVHAYEQLATAVEDLVKVLDGIKDRRSLLVVSADDVKAAGQYRIALLELQQIEDAYAKATESTMPRKQGVAATPIYVAVAALSTILDLTKLFRSDRTIYAETTTIQPGELFDLLVLQLRKSGDQKRDVQYPAELLDTTIISGNSDFIESVKKLNEARTKVEDQIAPIERKEEKDRTPDEKSKLAALRSLTGRHDKLASALSTIGANGAPNLFVVLLGELVAKAMSDASSPLLTAAIVQQGGMTVIDQRVGADKILSNGGVIVSYRLTADSKLVAAGSIAKRSKLKQIPLE